jgi:transposase-like protein
MSADLQNPIFNNEDKAREALEAVRWPDGPVCPHCGNSHPDRLAKGKGKVARPGLWYCAECNGQFTVTVGTVFERSKIPLSKWWFAMHLMGSSKKGVSSHQLHRMLGVTYKTAWFMSHRIREAMRDLNPGPLGGGGHIIEADETYFGDNEREGVKIRKSGKRGLKGKRAIVALVQRGSSVRSFHVEDANLETVEKILFTNASRESALHTDESKLYTDAGKE